MEDYEGNGTKVEKRVRRWNNYIKSTALFPIYAILQPVLLFFALEKHVKLTFDIVNQDFKLSLESCTAVFALSNNSLLALCMLLF